MSTEADSEGPDQTMNAQADLSLQCPKGMKFFLFRVDPFSDGVKQFGQVSKFVQLTLTTLWANSADDKLVIFFLFFPETGFYILCKLFPFETIFTKCQTLFSEKKNEKILHKVVC